MTVAMILILALGLTSGVLIGCIGIGGVILIPALVYFAGVPIRVGIPAAMAAYLLPGIVATAIFARKKSIHWDMAAWICAGATPTAFAGAWAVSVVNPRILEATLGLLTLLSGINSLKMLKIEDAAVPSTSQPHNRSLLVVGAITGFLSSVSGTGGPLVLVPILISIAVPVLTAVGLSQVIQLPVAVAATFGNIFYGHIDLTLAGLLTLSLTVGAWCGAKLAHILPRMILRRIVSVVLLVVGTFILGNVAWRLLY
jgi:uncharacterized membrane protein YfcA